LARTLVAGKRKVEEGHFAIATIRPMPSPEVDVSKLSSKEKEELEHEAELRTRIQYYKRVGDNWIHDTSVSDETFLDTNQIFCNVNAGCNYTDVAATVSGDKCMPNSIAELRMRNASQKRLLQELDNRYELSVEQIEKQLSDRKSSEWGHVSDDKPKMAPKQAQSESTKTINTQLEPSRKNQKGNEFLEALLNKLNKVDFNTEETIEENLTDDGLIAHRGEDQESYPEQTHEGYYDGKERPYAPKDLKSNPPLDSISHLLNKTAKKNDVRGLNDTLNDSRNNTKGDKTQEESLEDRHHNEVELDKSREELLAGLDEDDWGHQYSDEEFEGFMKDFGLDSTLEDKRNQYKVGK